MYPHTRALLDALSKEETYDAEPVTGPRGDDFARGDDKFYQLQLKKKYQTNLLRKMLADAGYDDLAKMTTIRKARFEDEGDM